MKTIIIHSLSFPDLALKADLSQLSDPDDLIKEVESQLFSLLKKPYHYNIDFTIQNFPELCEEILQK